MKVNNNKFLDLFCIHSFVERTVIPFPFVIKCRKYASHSESYYGYKNIQCSAFAFHLFIVLSTILLFIIMNALWQNNVVVLQN